MGSTCDVLRGCGEGEAVRGRLGGLGGDGALILAAVFMGLNYVAIKVAVVSVPPLLIGALRFVLGGSCSLESCALSRR